MRPQNKLMKFTSAMALIAITVGTMQPLHVDAATAKHMRVRITHAKELLGPSYKKSIVRTTESADDVAEFVKAATQRFLPAAYKKNSAQVATTILTEADRYGFDPIFLMAVIQNESSFNPRMKGSFGEIGLMQVKPSTAEWIAKSYKIDYSDAKALYEPETNIKIGAAFIHKLRGQFDAKSRLYVSAYNIGAKKVRSMVRGKNAPKEYVMAVMKRYIAIYSAFNATGDHEAKGQMAFLKVSGVTNHAQVATNQL
jgi:soluble lytic murein transglycosylase